MHDTLGSRLLETNRCAKSTEYLNELFPNEISTQLPQNEAHLLDLKKQLEHDTKILKAKANVLTIRKFLTCKEIECNDLEELSISIKDRLLTNENMDMIVGHALAHHLRNNPSLPKDGKMILPIESLKYGSSVVQITHSGNKSSKNALKAVVTENEFENNLLSDVIPPKDIGVTFEDIGAVDNVKDTLKELVMVPLQRPELFSKGNLTKPVKGIQLFGPHGTGKTMVAKAVATEAGANFINVSMSSITSKWLGEGEKYVKAIFSLASKLSPAVIFVDEVDSFLGRRLESTKLMMSLPDTSSRENILKVILSKEELAPDVNLQLLANTTDGYSGNDLKNLCMAAAQYPIREVMEERKGKSLARDEGGPEPPLDIHPLAMADLKLALKQVGASFSPDSRNTNELVKWNDRCGEGRSRKKETLTYFM